MNVESNTQHTPGPWKIQTKEDNHTLSDSENYRGVKSGSGFFDPETLSGFNISGYMSKADIELIVRAPRMYAFIEKLAIEGNEEAQQIIYGK